jgi:hypothetical protein
MTWLQIDQGAQLKKSCERAGQASPTLQQRPFPVMTLQNAAQSVALLSLHPV